MAVQGGAGVGGLARHIPWWVWPPILFLVVTAVGLLTAPHADADGNSTEVAFVEALDSLGVPYERAALIELGHIVCEQLDLGMDLDTAEGSMIIGGFTPDQATVVSHATIGTLCPRHTDLLADTRTALR